MWMCRCYRMQRGVCRRPPPPVEARTSWWQISMVCEADWSPRGCTSQCAVRGPPVRRNPSPCNSHGPTSRGSSTSTWRRRWGRYVTVRRRTDRPVWGLPVFRGDTNGSEWSPNSPVSDRRSRRTRLVRVSPSVPSSVASAGGAGARRAVGRGPCRHSGCATTSACARRSRVWTTAPACVVSRDSCTIAPRGTAMTTPVPTSRAVVAPRGVWAGGCVWASPLCCCPACAATGPCGALPPPPKPATATVRIEAAAATPPSRPRNDYFTPAPDCKLISSKTIYN